MDYELVIIGAGPAGLTAGIYAVRRGLKAVVIERAAVGGQILKTSEIENWPGERLITGPALAKKMEDHARDLGVQIIFNELKSIVASDDGLTLYLRDRELTTQAIILATGGKHASLKIEGEEEYSGRGVSYCATCDAPFFKNKDVAVIGGGTLAFEDALYMSEICNKTYLVTSNVTADSELIERVKKSDIEVIDDLAQKITGADFVQKIELKSQRVLDVDGVFVCVGGKPSTELAEEAGIEVEDTGFIKIDRDQKTNLAGVYAAGDVTGGIPQISTAVGEAATATLRAYQYIRSKQA